MLQSRFFWRLYASYAVLILVTCTVIGLLVQRQLERTLEEGLERTLQHEALMLEPFALRCLAGQESQIAKRVTTLAGGTDTRITVIRSDGLVIADSDEDPAHMDDHGSRPEVVAARSADFGTSRRRSATVGYPMLYVARTVEEEGRPLGFVRVSIPLTAVDARLAAMQSIVVAGALLGLAVSLLLGLVVGRRITAPLAEMTKVAEEMRRGNYARRPRRPRDDEIGLLGETLDRLGEELTRRIDTINRDRNQLSAMFSGMVEGVVAVDGDGRVLLSNAAACELLDAEPDVVQGELFEHAFGSPQLADLLAQARREGRAVRTEVLWTRGDRELELEANATPFGDDVPAGEPGHEPDESFGGVVMVLHDLSELRALERIRRDFVANVSHELKTPLTSIRGYAETLSDELADQGGMAPQFLDKISKNADRLSTLVSDLLSLSRIQSQEGFVSLEAVDLVEMVEEAGRRYQDRAHRKSIDLEILPPAEPVVVRGDREAITEILDNLVDNALKYTPDGGSVRLVLSRGARTATLSVEDTGVGIPLVDQDRIFERFYRVDKARSRELGGSGLGLSIVKHLVLAMNGSVDVRSQPGEGSCFSVRLPLQGAPGGAAQAPAKPSPGI